MRAGDFYRHVHPQIWTGDTGRAIRGDADAQIVQFYLLTCQHSSPIGAFYCPIAFIAHDTGRGIEGASKGLARLVKLGFCAYDGDREIVWIREMGAFQVGFELKTADKRHAGICESVKELHKCSFYNDFLVRYAEPWKLGIGPVDGSVPPQASPSEAPPKPLRSQEQEQEQEQKQEQKQEKECSEPARPAREPDASPVAVAPDPVVMDFPVTGDKSAPTWSLSESKVAEWRESYPGLDVMAELRKARQWLLDNPTKRKTKNGITRFLGSWLARTQDRGPTPSNGRPYPASGSGGRAAPAGVHVLPSSDADRRDGVDRFNQATNTLERWSAEKRQWSPLPQTNSAGASAASGGAP